MLPKVGAKKLVSVCDKRRASHIRKRYAGGDKGLSVVTVNYYMTTIAGMFQFAADNGYVSENPFNGIKPLKRARIEPDPLTT